MPWNEWTTGNERRACFSCPKATSSKRQRVVTKEVGGSPIFWSSWAFPLQIFFISKKSKTLLLVSALTKREKRKKEKSKIPRYLLFAFLMDTKRVINIFIFILVSSPCLASAGDIVHQDNNAPKRPGCDNNFVLVSRLSFCNLSIFCFSLFSWIGYVSDFVVTVWLTRKLR